MVSERVKRKAKLSRVVLIADVAPRMHFKVIFGEKVHYVIYRRDARLKLAERFDCDCEFATKWALSSSQLCYHKVAVLMYMCKNGYLNPDLLEYIGEENVVG